MRATFNTTFFIQRTRCNSEGKAPIYCRLTVNRESIHISTKQWVLPDHWDSTTYRTTAQTKEEKLINKMLDEVQGSIQRHFYDLQGAGEVISAGKIKMRLCSTDERANMSIGKLFELFINDYEQLVLTQDYGHESFFRYKVCKDRVMHFISMNYKTSDLPLTSIDKRFLDKVDRSYLTQTELNKVMEKEFESQRLEQVRDVFIFCCFTGLPYIDAKKLTNQHLKVWSDGSLWLTLHRQKTKVPVNVKLLPIALEILDKYKDSIASRGGKLLPVLSNQKCNEYLKELAAVCGINKEIVQLAQQL